VQRPTSSIATAVAATGRRGIRGDLETRREAIGCGNLSNGMDADDIWHGARPIGEDRTANRICRR
jgi:hypothetical protein